jgi:hypothetical protein
MRELEEIKNSPGSLVEDSRRGLQRTYRIPFLMYGMLSVCLGLAMYLFGVLLVAPRYVLGLNAILLPINEWIVWYRWGANHGRLRACAWRPSISV